MNIIYYVGRLRLGGGTRIMAQHVEALKSMGHNAVLATLARKDDYDFGVPVSVFSGIDALAATGPDLAVACHAADIAELYGKFRKLVFFVQGYHFEELEIYHSERRRLPRYAIWPGRLILNRRIARERRKLSEIYQLPLSFWCVSPVTAMHLQSDFGISAQIIRNSIDHDLFYPEEPRDPVPSIVCIGSADSPRKNISRAMEAVSILKKSRQARFIRISPVRERERERERENLLANCKIADELHECLPRKDFAAICRKAHILFSPSLQEGFGLPAVEGMACGSIAVLSDIPVYHSFHTGLPERPYPYALYCVR